LTATDQSAVNNSADNVILAGDRVLFYYDARRTWLTRVTENSPPFHTHVGIIKIAEAVGLAYGSSIITTLGCRIFLLKPVALDYIMKSERRTQIVYPKDFGYIAARSGLRSGCKVFECGTGSGGLTTFFASLVYPTGVVHTFEEREDFINIAKKNVERTGFSSVVKFEHTNPTRTERSSYQAGSYDLALLDTGDPWNLLPLASDLLRGSGFVFCICPTTNQAETVCEALSQNFVDVECVEILLRRIEARLGKTRPSMRMIGHTCYLASGRKIKPEPPLENS
jgi:tRNA (adenine57-N1/adenine58-N1)-methyltransferase catalytic subunit